MEPVQKFKADDGTLFDDPEKAEKRDRLISKISLLKKTVRADEVEEGCSFSNGDGFKQLTQAAVDTFTYELEQIIEDEHGEEYAKMFKKKPKGIIGRYLCDSGGPVNNLYQYILCIDSSNRLWGQPYFAINPHQGKQVAL